MNQYDPIVIKSGVLTTLGVDTLRDDLTAKALLTTAALATGDVCQMNGDTTLAKAVNTNADPCVGVYNGVTGSIVQEGAVAVTLAAGVVLANGDAVYLAAQPGRATNVKPTTDMLHELGVVLDAASATIFWQPRPVVVRAASTLMFDARSSWLLQGDAPPAQPGEQQAFPNTAVDLIAAMPGTAALAANVRGAYLCADAVDQTDALGIGPNLVKAGDALTLREAVGLPTSSFNTKQCIEFQDTSVFADAGAAYGDANNSIVALLTVFRFGFAVGARDFIQKYDGGPAVGWYVTAGATYLRITGRGPGAGSADLVCAPQDGAWHWAIFVIDDIAKTVTLFSDLGSATIGYVGSVANAGHFELSDGLPSPRGQMAVCYVLNAALTLADGQSFWRAFNLNEFNVPVAYTRAGPLVAPITASRVACYGANQPAVGFNTNFVAGSDNLLKSGVVCEDGISFEPIGSDSIIANTNPWVVATTSVDGPSAMRDGMRVTQAAAWWGGGALEPAGGCAIVGVSNVPWRSDVDYRRATSGTTARHALLYTGSGVGTEWFDLIVDAASPVDWVRDGGTCTPVNADQTAVYAVMGAANIGDDCDFGEPALVKNRATAPLAWRRVGLIAAAATATPACSMTNVGNARYSPAKGTAVVRIAGFPGTTSAGGGAILEIGNFGATPGALLFSVGLYGAAPAFHCTMRDNVGGIVAILACGNLTSAEHTFTIEWNAAAGIFRVSEGGVVLAQSTTSWTPAAVDVTPIRVGWESGAGGGAPRCLVALLQLVNT